jgi:hypothetical protein
LNELIALLFVPSEATGATDTLVSAKKSVAEKSVAMTPASAGADRKRGSATAANRANHRSHSNAVCRDVIMMLDLK